MNEMICLTDKELAARTKTYKESSLVIYQDKILASGPVFSKDLKQTALKLCQEYRQKDIFCVLVENEWSLTIWIEKYKETKQKIIRPTTQAFEPKKSYKIACIDDSKTVQRQVKKILEWAGYEVVEILEPISSIKILVRQKPELILMDINMPEFDGYELCQMLHKSRKLKDVPVAMLTARDSIVDRIRAKMVGAVGYLNKPVAPLELVNFVKNIVPLPENK